MKNFFFERRDNPSDRTTCVYAFSGNNSQFPNSAIIFLGYFLSKIVLALLTETKSVTTVLVSFWPLGKKCVHSLLQDCHISVLTHAFLCQKIIFSSNDPNLRRKRTIPKINRTLQMDLTNSKNLPSGWKLSATSYYHPLHSQHCSSQNLLPKLIPACSVFKPFLAIPMEVRRPVKPSSVLGFIPYHPLQQFSWRHTAMHDLCESDHPASNLD